MQEGQRTQLQGGQGAAAGVKADIKVRRCDYGEAVDWCAFMVSERELHEGDLEGIGRREDQAMRATLRGVE